jgi:hypothetical protein
MSDVSSCHDGYGHVTIGADSVTVAANGSELRAWANRPGHHWPCSELAEASEIVATFDTNGLCDLTGDESLDLSGDELHAWTSDVIGAVLPVEHPCHYVTVGQFREDVAR